MRTFTRRPESRQAGPTRVARRSREMRDGNSAMHFQRTIGNQALQRRLSQQSRRVATDRFFRTMPVRAEQTQHSQNASRTAMAGETIADDVRFSHSKGGPKDGPKAAPAPKDADKKPTDDKKEQKKQKVKKTELAAPTTGDCGSYSWQVRFSVENADKAANGYIVQKIDAKYNRSECDGSADPVTGIGKFPYWEAWGVREGKIFIGDTDQEHNADTYADKSMGAGTKGSIVVTGIPEFFPNVTLPKEMMAQNPDTQAGDLRSSLTDPQLKGGTGSIVHDLTALWQCCPPHDTKTTLSNKR